MNISTASLSRQGERASNQDQTGETIGERSACFVVCDGIAGPSISTRNTSASM
ncbi:Protein phosphatase 2C-like:Protein phosphatase 2C-like [Cronobacter malonaticus 507]|nr:Protein phosphatase 2C-like:Protein phosphatase 2C-like [Cronobacter malonaticus 507]